jgi:hypothetical protein
VVVNLDPRSDLRLGTSEVANVAGAAFTVVTVTPELSFRILDRLSIAARMPLHVKRFVERGAHRDEDGAGDLELVGSAELLDLADAGGLRLTVSGGLAFPTGSTESQPFAGTIAPTPLQLGSGTFDPLVAVSFVVLARREIRFAASAGARLTLYENARDYRAASVIETRAGPEWSEGPVSLALPVVLSLVGRSRNDAEDVPSTGREVLYLAPEIELRPDDHVAVGAGLRIPLHLRVNERQLVEDFLVVFRISVTTAPLY